MIDLKKLLDVRVNEFLEGEDFYELMQAYRHAPLTPQRTVIDAFEAVKAFIRARL